MSKSLIITGGRASGKSRLFELINQLLSSKGIIKFDGILTKSSLANSGDKNSFKAFRLSDGKEILLCSVDLVSPIATYKYGFNKAAFKLGDDYINGKLPLPDVFLLDEIGILELRDEGWADFLRFLLKSNLKFLILSIRHNIVSEIIEKYSIMNSDICELDESADINAIAAEYIKLIEFSAD